MTSTELLTRLSREVALIIGAAKEFQHLPESTLNWKESPEKWSMLECLEHLNRYSSYYHNELRNSIDRGATSDSIHEVKSTWLGKKFIAMMHPDNREKQRTFKRMNPLHSSLGKDVIDRFIKNQEELLRLIENAAKANLNKATIAVEFLRILRMNLGDAFQFVVVHEQRHLKQAQSVKSNAETQLTPALKI